MRRRDGTMMPGEAQKESTSYMYSTFTSQTKKVAILDPKSSIMILKCNDVKNKTKQPLHWSPDPYTGPTEADQPEGI